MKNTQPTTDKPQIFKKYEDTDDAWVESLDKKINTSQTFWNNEYKLEKRTKSNEKLYLGSEQLDNEDGESLSLDNRIFSSIRTIVPYVTSRITEPEIYPSSNAPAAKRFAEDIEKASYIHAENEEVRMKAKFALEDAIIRRRGYLKPRYDPIRRNFCSVEYVPAESIIIDHKAKVYEEPRYFRHLLDKTVGDLLIMFPEMKAKILEAFGFDDKTSQSELDKECQINEDWCYVATSEGLDLIVTWSYKKMCLGKMQDPNWLYGKDNFLKYHMMPLVFFNVLSDGRTYVDKTSFVEQASLLQKNVNERSDQISKNAGLGNVGMPVVDSAALADDQSQFLAFEEDTVLELEVPDGKRISDVFDVWKAGTMPSFVYEDKIDSRNGIDNAFGTPNVFRGEQSDNNTLGQDVLVRDQAFGRQQEIVDAIDAAMKRLYLLMAQYLLVYGEKVESFEFNGDDGEFDYVMIRTDELDTKIKIRVKSGTSMPIDRAQRRATVDKAAANGMVDPLTYWEVMDEANAEKIAKRVMHYTNDPATFLQDIEDEVFNRDAFVDIEFIKNGQVPAFRKDLPKDYFDYLNQYILSGDLQDPAIPLEVKGNIQEFIDIQLARGQQMLGLIETQMPTPEEVDAANEETDALNEQAAAEQDRELTTAEREAKLAQTQEPPKK